MVNIFKKTNEKQVYFGHHKIVSGHGEVEALPYYSSNSSCSLKIFVALDYVDYLPEHF